MRIVFFALTIFFIVAGNCFSSEPLEVKETQEAANSLQEALADGILTTEEFSSLKRSYSALIEKYPDWYGGYDGLSTLALLSNDCHNSIKYALQANKQQANASSYYNLTLCYSQTKQYQSATSAANIAFEMNEAFLKNTQFLISSALAFAEVGKFKVSKNLLGLAIKANPKIKSNEAFLAVGNRLAEKMREAGLIK